MMLRTYSVAGRIRLVTISTCYHSRSKTYFMSHLDRHSQSNLPFPLSYFNYAYAIDTQVFQLLYLPFLLSQFYYARDIETQFFQLSNLSLSLSQFNYAHDITTHDFCITCRTINNDVHLRLPSIVEEFMWCFKSPFIVVEWSSCGV